MPTERSGTPHVIHIQPLAPPKPVPGAVCNGCGICCLAEPCPLGMLVSQRRTGACVALRWNAAGALYRCGLIGSTSQIAAVLRASVASATWRALAGWLAWPLRLLAKRWIAAGAGCDCSFEAGPAALHKADGAGVTSMGSSSPLQPPSPPPENVLRHD